MTLMVNDVPLQTVQRKILWLFSILNGYSASDEDMKNIVLRVQKCVARLVRPVFDRWSRKVRYKMQGYTLATASVN